MDNLINNEMLRLAVDVGECQRCTLWKDCKGKVFGDIGKNTEVVFIGEAPGSEENEQGRPFVGASGKLLRLWIKTVGLEDSQFSILNCLKCQPPNNRKPNIGEVSTCGVWIKKQLHLLGCKKIVLLGSTACDYFLSPTGFYDGGILKYVGTTFVAGEYKFFVMPHPSYVLRSGGIYDPPIDGMIKFIKDDSKEVQYENL